MALTTQQAEEVADVLRNLLRRKLSKYNPEPNSMPFHTRLLGIERLAVYSFIQSLNTSFGVGIFEQVASVLAKPHFDKVSLQTVAGSKISDQALHEIQLIMTDLTNAIGNPNMRLEVERLRKVCRSGKMITAKLARVDVALESNAGAAYLFDIKTPKPNTGDFQKFKRMLLEWTAAFLADNPDAEVTAAIAIPYNPYEPAPYNRWTMRGMLDIQPQSQLFVAAEFWDFLGGDGTYEPLLDVFEQVGIELRPDIDARFAKFR